MCLRIVLDSSVVRALIHGDALARPLTQLRRHNAADSLSIALADIVIPEVALALYEGRLSWRKWSSRAVVIDRLLDSEFPVFPNAQELRKIETELGKREIDSTLSRDEHMRQIWHLLRNAKSNTDLFRGPVFVGSDGIEYSLQSSVGLARGEIEQHRFGWKHMIDQIKGLSSAKKIEQAEITELLFGRLYGGAPNESRARVAYDAYVKSIARFIHLALHAAAPYNPHGEHRKGDSFDLELLVSLGQPALVCTLDERLKRHVHAAGSCQVSQLISPAELYSDITRGALEHRIPGLLRG